MSLGRHPDQFKIQASSATAGVIEEDDVESVREYIEDHGDNDERQLVSTDQTTNFDLKESEVEFESAGELGELKHATRYVKTKLVDALESLWAKFITIKRHPSWVSAGAKEYRAEWKLIL